MSENVIIIGSGPAGLTAALYAARANLDPLLISGNEFGGQIALTNEVENYPGFPDGITGPELTELMKQQAEKFGARVEQDHVSRVDFSKHPFTLDTENGARYNAQSVIIATGASPRRLGVPGELELTGRGVSYCATCDGFFFRGKDVAVIGGGDSALQEGLFLTRFASQVHIIHRRSELRAQQILQERARENPKINFVWDSVVQDIRGNGTVNALALVNVRTGDKSELPVNGVFVYIGHYPNTDLFKGQLEMNDEGYLKVDERLHTKIPGVFAAGEAHDHVFKQAIVSAGFGCMAAMEAEKFLADLEHEGYAAISENASH
ncbi:MAG: thioredoxin-disulfide reductase [Chloroflexota bacterium]|nr:MAG: thioredoxin-disulfide reductase [Chloroflexota bacterium]